MFELMDALGSMRPRDVIEALAWVAGAWAFFAMAFAL
jgi:hypothetical protein